MRPAAQPALSVSGLRVVRGGHEVLAGVDFEVPTGSVTGLLGPSGCGKTTLMRCLVGVQVVAEGTVFVLGRPAGSRELRSRVGYVTQTPAVYLDLTLAENLAYFAAVSGVTTERVIEVAGQVDLLPRLRQVVGAMSGGERARASLATALLGSPEVLVLDEPTVGLDPVLRRDLWQLFADLAAAGTTLLVSSHVMDEAERCERLLLMRSGLLIADGRPAELLARTGTRSIEDAFLRLVTAEAAT